MKEYSIIDGHCDTITKIMRKGEELFENTGHLDLKRLMKYNNPVQFFAIWLEPYFYRNPLRQTLKAIDFYYSQLEKYKDFVCHTNRTEDIFRNKKEKKISALLSLEGGEALEGDIHNLRIFYQLGVRAITLTWNFRNDLGQGNNGEEGRGLTDFGQEAVLEMNRLGILVDVSHLSDEGFYDVAGISQKPFMASHSNARSICNVPRNLTDKQIKIIADRGGIIGMNAYPPFVGAKGANIDSLMAHIDHIIKVGGMDCIGLGCDYDGMDIGIQGMEEVSRVQKLIQEIERKYGEEAAIKISEGNFLRFIKDVIG